MVSHVSCHSQVGDFFFLYYCQANCDRSTAYLVYLPLISFSDENITTRPQPPTQLKHFFFFFFSFLALEVVDI